MRASRTWGYNPTNAASYLKVDSFSVTNGVRLEFGAVSNRTYQVLRSTAVSGAPWVSVADIIARATNRTEVLLDATASTNRVYRIVTPRQP